MLTVSTAFNTAAKAAIRRPIARVEVCWTDPLLDLSIRATSSDNNRGSYLMQCADQIETVPLRWAHLGGGFGTNRGFHPKPSPSETVNYQVGWWTKVQCDANGAFSTPPVLDISFSARPMFSLLVCGDNIYNEYPVDFDINIYNGVTPIATRQIRGNTLVRFTDNITSLNIMECTRITIAISRWSTPLRVVKLSEFFSSINAVYEGNDIISLNILEEMELSEGSLPIGNISSNELDIKLQNIDDKFSPGNTASSLHTLVKQNRRMHAYLGFILPDNTRELVSMGTYWSGDWTVNESDAHASTTARDRMNLLRKMTYSTSPVLQNTSIGAMALVVLNAARLKMPDLKWSLDPALNEIEIPWIWFPRQDYMKTIKQLCQAALAVAYMDRNDTLIITIPRIDGTGTPYEITRDDYFTKNNPAKTEELANIIEVTTNPVAVESAPSEVATSDVLVVPASGSKTFTIKYSGSPAIGFHAGIHTDYTNQDCSITQSIFYATEADVTIRNMNAASQNVKVVITGYQFNDESKEIVTVRNEQSIREYGEMIYQFRDNHLVQNNERATAIANSLISTFNEVRKDIDLDWRGNPALTLADLIRVPDYQKNGIDNRRNYYITQQNISLDNGLRVKTQARYIKQAEDVVVVDYNIMQDTDDAAIQLQDNDTIGELYQDGD